MNKPTTLLTFAVGILLLLSFRNGFAQEKPAKVVCIAFYNIENLFDTIDSPDTDDKEFLPSATGKWNRERYHTKLQHLAEVINQIGSEETKDGPALAGLAEVENRGVLEELVTTPPLASRNYAFVHYESPDKRGIDVALIYQPKFFKVLESKPVPLLIRDNPDFRTRDVLLVHGLLNGESLYVMVTHWPSRGGDKVSAPLRAAAADLCRTTADSLRKINPVAKILIMGDLNDDPVDESLMLHLKTATTPDNVADSSFFNPMWQLFKNGEGTLDYKNAWNLFDQIIISGTFIRKKPDKSYRYMTAKIFKKDFLIQQDGQFAGYPLRTFGGKKYLGGYSDHLPVYILLVRGKK